MNAFKKLTAKKVLVFSVYILLFALVVFLTAVPVVFDLENLNVQQWLTNSLINVGIMIVAIILGEITGNDKLKERVVFERDANGNTTDKIVGGLYQKALYNYNEILDSLTQNGLIVFFSQFYTWYKARELKNKKIAFLVNNGFDHQVAIKIISFIERDDLDKMLHENVVKIDQKTKKEIKFKRIYQDEYEVLTQVLSTTFQLEDPKEYTYYLSAFNDNSSASILEKPKIVEKKERSNLIFNRTFKIATSIFISVLWGSAAISEVNGGAKAIIGNLIARLIALVGGVLSGFLTSAVTVKLESEKLEDKTKVLKDMQIHTDKGNFVPKTYEQMVDEEISIEKETNAVVNINIQGEQKQTIEDENKEE